MWLSHKDKTALEHMNHIQMIGALQLLGISDTHIWDRSNKVEPMNAITETGLMPAIGMYAQGVLRFYRIAKTREPESMLGKMWEIVEADRQTYGTKEGINHEVALLLEKYDTIDWPLFLQG